MDDPFPSDRVGRIPRRHFLAGVAALTVNGGVLSRFALADGGTPSGAARVSPELRVPEDGALDLVVDRTPMRIAGGITRSAVTVNGTIPAPTLRMREGQDVVIAKSDEGYEPLHAVYRRETCLPAIEASIDADQWRVIAWFPHVKVRVLTTDEIKQHAPSGLAFWNVNTPEEFSKAETISLSGAERF